MLNSFPLIDQFFKKKKFSDSELKDLITKLENKYDSHKTLKEAKSIIELHLLSFKLQKIKTQNTSNKSKSSKSKKTKQSYHIDKVDLFLKHTLNRPLIKVCYYLSIDKSILLNRLNLDNINDLKLVRFKKSHYHNIKDLVVKAVDIQESELKKGYRKVPVRSRKFNKKTNNSNDVFSKIKSQGGVGKIIYIKS